MFLVQEPQTLHLTGLDFFFELVACSRDQRADVACQGEERRAGGDAFEWCGRSLCRFVSEAALIFI